MKLLMDILWILYVEYLECTEGCSSYRMCRNSDQLFFILQTCTNVGVKTICNLLTRLLFDLNCNSSFGVASSTVLIDKWVSLEEKF